MNRPNVEYPPHDIPEQVVAMLVSVIDSTYELLGAPVLSAVADWLASKTGKAN